ncbi:MAG: serine protease [Lachnospiraceae bacterium]|nr:serine protease [Lachnospiraceae bacterium]
MKSLNNNKSVFIGVTLGIVAAVSCSIIVPVLHEKKCKNRVYKDMQSKAETIEQSVIGIIPETKTDGAVSHDGIGSGVIFEKNENIYYAVTAAHVVENDNSSYKIFTRNTEFSGQSVKADENASVVFEIPDENYYESLLDGKVEYKSDTTDLAIVSFETEEELPLLEFEDSKIEKGNRIMCIGHPEGNRYEKTYGTITSGLKTATTVSKLSGTKSTDKIYEHNAYLNFGNSGGVAISENMKIAGINNGGEFTKAGHFSKGFMIPYDIVEENIEKWKNN